MNSRFDVTVGAAVTYLSDCRYIVRDSHEHFFLLTLTRLSRLSSV
jgi:hypothetical protein